jgi:hypothetical protein
MADQEAAPVDRAPVQDGVEDEEEGDEVFLDTTMFDEDDEWLEGALAAPEDEDDDPYYFVQARTTGKPVILATHQRTVRRARNQDDHCAE